MKIHDGGRRRPGGTGPDLGPLPQGGVPIIPPPRVASARDVVEHVQIREGTTYASGDESKWITTDVEFVVLGATLLKDLGGDRWGPVIGARVVLRLQDGSREAFDLCTRGNGATVQVPAGAIVVRRGARWRVEVQVPGATGATARVVLHTIVET